MNNYIGALFMIGIPGTELDRTTKEIMSEFPIGGVIIFSKNITDPFQLAHLCKELQELSIRIHDIPLFIAVDQEGGRVSRLPPPFTQFAGNLHIASSKDPIKQADEFARVTSYEMRLVGLNMNMAPVLDVCFPCPEFLKKRSFGSDPNKVATLGEIMTRRFIKERIICVAKHFPGLGASEVDPHYELPIVDISYKELKEVHMYPFKRVIAVDIPCIMVSHAIYPEIDPNSPASISSKVIRILRKEFGFNRIIITDDMEMGAIKKEREVFKSAIDAIKAGIDIVLICRDREEVIKSISILKSIAKKNKIFYERIMDSYHRILNIKRRYIAKIEISFKEIKDYFNK